MAEVAAHITDQVLPNLPVRQWALSVPKRLRPFLQHNPLIAGAVLRIFVRVIRTTLCRASPGRTELQLSPLELGDFLLDQTSGFDPAEAEPVPDFVFDQSLPEEFEA
jgi:hypothetical protein